MAFPVPEARIRAGSFPGATGQMSDARIDDQLRSIDSTQIRILTDTLVRKVAKDHAELRDALQQNITNAFSTPSRFVVHGIHLQITDYDAFGNSIGGKAVDLTVKVRDVIRNCRITFALNSQASRQQSTLVFNLTVIKDGIQVYSENATLRNLLHSGYLNYSSNSRVYSPPQAN